MKKLFRTLTIATLTLAGASFSTPGIAGDDSTSDDRTLSGRASVYQNLHQESLEHVTDPDRIIAVTRNNVAPMEVWRALEHAERVECLDCIPYVSPLLYDSHGKTREIAAWWLRRRVFGVFGPGEIYSTLAPTLATDESEIRRAYAAEALGEFLIDAGIEPVAAAAVGDSSPRVRVSAVQALRRLNTEGPNGELAMAMADPAQEVRLVALQSAVRINVFRNVDAVAARIADEDAEVRRAAVNALGHMRLTDAAVELMALTDPAIESDARVRVAAVAALGKLGELEARDAVEEAMSDPDFLVRSAARVALRQL